MVEKIHTKWPKCSIVVSLPIARGDNHDHNRHLQECSIILQHDLLYLPYIYLCNNTAVSVRGQINEKFFTHDRVHLNAQGISVFVSNLKFYMFKALKIEKSVKHDYEKNNDNYPSQNFKRYENYKREQMYYPPWYEPW